MFCMILHNYSCFIITAHHSIYTNLEIFYFLFSPSVNVLPNLLLMCAFTFFNYCDEKTHNAD